MNHLSPSVLRNPESSPAANHVRHTLNSLSGYLCLVLTSFRTYSFPPHIDPVCLIFICTYAYITPAWFRVLTQVSETVKESSSVHEYFNGCSKAQLTAPRQLTDQVSLVSPSADSALRRWVNAYEPINIYRPCYGTEIRSTRPPRKQTISPAATLSPQNRVHSSRTVQG